MAIDNSHCLRFRRSGTTYTMYVYTTPPSGHYIAFRVNNNTYYVQLTTTNTYKLPIRIGSTTYYPAKPASKVTFNGGGISYTMSGLNLNSGFSISNGGFTKAATIYAEAYINLSSSRFDVTNSATINANVTSSSSIAPLTWKNFSTYSNIIGPKIYYKICINVFNTVFTLTIATAQTPTSSYSLKNNWVDVAL